MTAAQAAGEEAPPGVCSVKVVLVGDGGCGKTSLLTVFADGAFPESYTPTVFERHLISLQVKGKPVHLHIWDTAGARSPEGSDRPHSAQGKMTTTVFGPCSTLTPASCCSASMSPARTALTTSLPGARRWRGPWVRWPTLSARLGSMTTSTPSSRRRPRWLSAAAVATSGGRLPRAFAW
ncbi:rho-related GTP-binding protein RhoD isoform X2 [Saimiri boliviensis]|uniref:rho-related GTP-binding protein RhoD isoform X2 n=1 Tax=Saimiri boliviensis TaxID=27679 RepID=UPI003D7781C7